MKQLLFLAFLLLITSTTYGQSTSEDSERKPIEFTRIIEFDKEIPKKEVYQRIKRALDGFNYSTIELDLKLDDYKEGILIYSVNDEFVSGRTASHACWGDIKSTLEIRIKSGKIKIDEFDYFHTGSRASWGKLYFTSNCTDEKIKINLKRQTLLQCGDINEGMKANYDYLCTTLETNLTQEYKDRNDW